MTFGSCKRHCQRYEECRAIIDTLRAYERERGEKHPIERVFFAEWSVPHCHRVHPPQAGVGG